MVKPTKPIDIYLRVSRVGGREHMISPAEQERRARELAKERGLTVGVVLTDLDESGGKWDRPGLQEALRRVREGQSGGLIVAWLDRLSRDSEHAHRLVRELNESGGAVYAPDAPSDWTSPEGELQAGIVFAFAQYVRKRARAGFERAKEQAIANGIPVARIPIGYRQRADRRLEPDPATAPLVRELFERRAAGAGPTELAEYLEAKGIRTTQGASTWSKQTVASVLRNRIYLGELSYGRGEHPFVNAASHEPLVDVATFEAAQHPGGRRLHSQRSEGRYLLTGLLRCAGCGYSMQATATSRGRRIYRCVRRHAGGICGAPARFAADAVEDAAERAFWAVADDLRATGEVAEPTHDLAKLAVALERAERRLAQAMAPEVQDAAGDSWSAMIRERRQERDAAAGALGQARADQGSATAIPGVETLRETWAQLSVGERRELMAACLDLLALSRDVGLVAYPRGTAPEGLSRRGFYRNPGLHPLDVPAGARTLALQ